MMIDWIRDASIAPVHRKSSCREFKEMENLEDLQKIIDKLPQEDKIKLVTFIQQEQQKQEFQEAVNQYSDSCFKMCITKIKPSLRSSEQDCIRNCVDRFIDSSVLLLKSLANQ